MRARSYLSAIGLALNLMSTPVARGDQLEATPQRPSPMLLGILNNAGVSEDTDSLLVAARAHADPTVRWAAIETLGQRKERQALPLLLDVLEHEPDRLIRETAALALARLGEEQGFAALRRFMASPEDRAQQLFLATRLAELGDPSGYRHVATAARAEAKALRAAAAEALVPFLSAAIGETDAPAPAELLLGLSSDESVEVRSAFLTYLPAAVRNGLPVDEAHRAAQQVAQSDPDPELREQAK
ncbi:MAG: HEAT repeat domain-containing protein, partial [Acidimicrobiales bacterium]